MSEVYYKGTIIMQQHLPANNGDQCEVCEKQTDRTLFNITYDGPHIPKNKFVTLRICDKCLNVLKALHPQILENMEELYNYASTVAKDKKIITLKELE